MRIKPIEMAAGVKNHLKGVSVPVQRKKARRRHSHMLIRNSYSVMLFTPLNTHIGVDLKV